MLKLISQFDNQKTRPSLATPTCCCCCCCIVTVIGYNVVTTRMLLKKPNTLQESQTPPNNPYLKLIPSFLLILSILFLCSPSLGIFKNVTDDYIAFLGLILLPIGMLISLFFLRLFRKTSILNLFLMVGATLALFILEAYIWGSYFI